MSQIKGRVTKQKLLEWVKKEFVRLEITDYEPTKIDITHFRQDDYEGGACRLYVWFKNKTMPDNSFFSNHYFLCFYRLGEYEKYIRDGYELYLRFRNSSRINLLTDLEIEVRKAKEETK